MSKRSRNTGQYTPPEQRPNRDLTGAAVKSKIVPARGEIARSTIVLPKGVKA